METRDFIRPFTGLRVISPSNNKVFQAEKLVEDFNRFRI